MSPQIAQQVSTRPTPPDPAPLGLTPIGTAAIKQTQDAQISEIVDHLELRYTPDQISIAELNRRVRTFYCQFEGARVRSFVAILVEGLVRRSIHSPAQSPRLQ